MRRVMLTRYGVSDTHQRRMQSRHNAPDCTVSNETRQSERKEIPHEYRTSGFPQRKSKSHSTCYRCYFSRGLLPWCDSHNFLGFGIVCRVDRTWGRRGRSWCSWHNVSFVCDDRASNNFILQVYTKVFLLWCHRKEEFGDIVRIQCR